jgi:hypothetical protein
MGGYEEEPLWQYLQCQFISNGFNRTEILIERVGITRMNKMFLKTHNT